MLLRALSPASFMKVIRRGKRWGAQRLLEMIAGDVEPEHIERILNTHGLNVTRFSDFYSPLPVMAHLKKNTGRWSKPSALAGVQYDVESMKNFLRRLVAMYFSEYQALPGYRESKAKGYGPGFTIMDAMLLYFMIREIKPRRYIEIGSGLSTYYCSLARRKNASEASPLRITCIDPYPFEGLRLIPEIDVIANEVQDIDVAFFQELDAQDVLFIDSTHVVKLDGDVPYLYLEVIPRLNPGVLIHIHDVHFPYNIPYPPQFYVMGRAWGWPMFWTEAMMAQAFLCFNDRYRIVMSLPLLRFFCEDFLRMTVPTYTPLVEFDTATHYGSLWIQRV